MGLLSNRNKEQIKQNLSLLVNEKVPWADIEAAISRKASAKLQSADVFRDADGTLTHEQVDNFEKVILNELNSSLGAVLRTA